MRTRSVLYAATAIIFALCLAMTLWAPADTVQADPPEERPGQGLSQAEIIPNSLTSTCSITCSDGSETETEADNAGDCACDCADYCGGTCTATDGEQVATCGPA